MDVDIQERLITRHYDKFKGAMDEYMFLALTEDCHPLIDEVEKIVCAIEGVHWGDYCDGELEIEDEIRHEAHTIATRVMCYMLRRFADEY